MKNYHPEKLPLSFLVGSVSCLRIMSQDSRLGMQRWRIHAAQSRVMKAWKRETSHGCSKNLLKVSNPPKEATPSYHKPKESGFKAPKGLNRYLSIPYPRVNQRYSQTVQTIVFRKKNSQCASSSGTKSKVKAKRWRKKSNASKTFYSYSQNKFCLVFVFFFNFFISFFSSFFIFYKRKEKD